MSGSKINDYGVGDVNATSIMTTLDAQRIGYHALTLTEYDTTTKPAIAAGSKVEINGALFKFDSEDAISGSPSDGDVYILLTPSGDSVTASFTNTAPTWSDSKQGWYGTGGSENYRYANFVMTKSGTDYSDKKTLLPDPMKKISELYTDVTATGFHAYVTGDLELFEKNWTDSGDGDIYIYQNSDWRLLYEIPYGASSENFYAYIFNPGKYRWNIGTPFDFYIKKPITAWVKFIVNALNDYDLSLHVTGAFGETTIATASDFYEDA